MYLYLSISSHTILVFSAILRVYFYFPMQGCRMCEYFAGCTEMEQNGSDTKPIVVDMIKQEEHLASPEAVNDTSDELISVSLPTHTRSNKRKHIRSAHFFASKLK